jgi:hypothetical protein
MSRVGRGFLEWAVIGMGERLLEHSIMGKTMTWVGGRNMEWWVGEKEGAPNGLEWARAREGYGKNTKEMPYVGRYE